MTGLLHHRVTTLRLDPQAPWPRQAAATRAGIVAEWVKSDPMTTPQPRPPACPVFAPSTGQIVAFPVASGRNKRK